MSNFPESTLQRGLYLLQLMSDQRVWAFKELLSACDGAASTTLNRLLKSLLDSGHVTKHDAGYALGPKYLAMVQMAISGRSVEDVLEPLVKELSQRSGDSAAFFRWDGDGIFVNLKFESPNGMHFADIGNRDHPLEHAFYRVIQAWLSEGELDRLGLNDRSGLESIRSEKFLMKIEPFYFPHLRLAAPVFRGKGKILGALGMSIPAVELSEPERVKRVGLLLEMSTKASEYLQTLLGS
jgi:DNA-binding IclR family transcriptional regulator